MPHAVKKPRAVVDNVQRVGQALLVVYDRAPDALPRVLEMFRRVRTLGAPRDDLAVYPRAAKMVPRAEAGVLVRTEFQAEVLVPPAQAGLVVEFGARGRRAAPPQTLIARVMLAQEAAMDAQFAFVAEPWSVRIIRRLRGTRLNPLAAGEQRHSDALRVPRPHAPITCFEYPTRLANGAHSVSELTHLFFCFFLLLLFFFFFLLLLFCVDFATIVLEIFLAPRLFSIF